MKPKLVQEIVQWHGENGGFNARPAGHAVRMLREMVELCFAAGASTREIAQAVTQEFRKARDKKEITENPNFEKTAEEAADVAMLFEVFKAYNVIDLEDAVVRKLQVNFERLWEVDADGVLWRPGSRAAVELYPDDPDRKTS